MNYPALNLWSELTKSNRGILLKNKDLSALWRSACWELNAREALRAGDVEWEKRCQVEAIGALLYGWRTGKKSNGPAKGRVT